MSLILDDEEREIDGVELLEEILKELKLLNARIEHGFETGIEEAEE